MAFTFSIKQVRGGKWHHVLLDQVGGKSWREALAAFENTEAVAEFIFDDEKVYFCGTDEWVERMKQKGRAMRFGKAGQLFTDKKECTWLDGRVPMFDDISDIFPGAELSAHEEGIK